MERWCPHWGPQHFEAFGVPHIGTQLFHPLWDFCCPVPSARLARVIPALWNNLSASKSYILRHHSNVDNAYTSSKKANNHFPGRSSACTSCRALCTAKLKRSGISGSEISEYTDRTNGNRGRSASTSNNFSKKALRNTWSICHCANCVADAICANPRRQSKLERGARLNILMNWRASVRATRRRNDVPVAMPLTPPSVLDTAVMVAIVKSCVTSVGAEPRAKSSAASNSNWRTSQSSKQTRNISWLQPPGPGADPERAPLKHLVNTFELSSRGRSGTLQHFVGYLSHLLLWSSPLKFLESCVVLRGQNCSRQRLSSRHLSLLDQRLCHPATPLFFTLIGTSAATSCCAASLSNCGHLPCVNASTLLAS